MTPLALASALLGGQVPASGQGGTALRNDVSLSVQFIPADRNRKAESERLARYQLTYRNGGDRPVTIWFTDLWLNHRVFLKNERGEDVPLTKEGEAARDAFKFDYGSRDHNIDHDLAPGGSWSRGFLHREIARLFVVKPGRYEMTVEYFEQAFNRIRAVSTPILIVVTAKDIEDSAKSVPRRRP